VRQLIQQQAGWELSGEATDAESALELICRIEPDLALIDLRLRGGDGLSLIGQVCTRVPSVKMLVSSMQDEELFAERSIRAGALGYINKQQSVQVLLEAIECVLQGKIYLSPEMTERMVLRSAGRQTGTIARPLEVLSIREMEIFERFGDGKTVKQIAYELHISAKTVEYHRQHIKEKLKLPSSNAVVRMAIMYALGSNCEVAKGSVRG
jgi:DNA-binding NarL/FixJ family response regulator